MTFVTLFAVFGAALGLGSTLMGFKAQDEFNKDPNRKVTLFKKKNKYITLENKKEEAK